MEAVEKIFLPVPEYTSDSVTSMGFILRVGSRAVEAVPTFAATPVDGAAALEAGDAGFDMAAGAGGGAAGVSEPLREV
jgi:hypothetical protein